MIEKVRKSDEEWRAQLTDEQYQVLRKAGTERAFTGSYNDCKDPGLYRCSGCDAPLFRSETKFDSGTGWPSFWEPIEPGAVEERTDSAHGMIRTEVVCGSCEGHLGHVFPDGPNPTGQRYCMNSVSLRLDAEED
jgi:peptide-methionine (R)-S-oxide reductase